MSLNGVKHQTTPPYHPSTNGFAENAVKSFKSSIIKALKDEANSDVSFETIVNRYLFHYRNSAHITTGVTPSSLVFKHKIRNRFDLLTEKNSNDKNTKHYQGKREERFREGEVVLCRDYRNPNKKSWIEAKIDEVLGDRIYLCKVLNDNVFWKRHVNQILRTKFSENELPKLKFSTLESDSIPNSNNSNLYNDDKVPNNAVLETRVDSTVQTRSAQSEGEESQEQVSVEEEKVCVDDKNLGSKKNERIKNVQLNVNERPKRHIKIPVRLDL